jgi:hypothetical protein
MPKSHLTLYIIVIAALCASAWSFLGAVDRATDHSADHAFDVVDSHAFLQSHMTPAGPAASASAPAVEKLLAQMTLKEKVGQMSADNRDDR